MSQQKYPHTLKLFDRIDKFGEGLIGIEKEALRMKGDAVSGSSIQEKLGSALCNKYITTDFSEALTEFITPPKSINSDVSQFLEDIHKYYYKLINQETLWPMSMPPNIKDTSSIPIAYYGKSNEAKLKHLYRKGLSNRYGRPMQIISGVHFNYSISEDLWNDLDVKKSTDIPQIKSEFYFTGLRNIKRKNWLLLYLFGSSPIIPKVLVQSRKDNMVEISKDYYLMKNSTSLRMSSYGYVNPSQEKIKISYNSIEEYIRDLRKATRIESQIFSKIPEKINHNLSQINKNMLQIEDEYYSEARPKSDSAQNKRMLDKLKNNGVSYLEIRSLDIDPFSRSGISESTIAFMELFTLYALFGPNQNISDKEDKEIRSNSLRVALEGRNNNLKLSKSGNKVQMKSWGKTILDEMLSFSEIIGLDDSIYKVTLEDSFKKLDSPNETPSYKLIESITQSHNINEEVLNIATMHKESFSGEVNSNEKLLNAEKKQSFKRQATLDSNNQLSFEDFLRLYS